MYSYKVNEDWSFPLQMLGVDSDTFGTQVYPIPYFIHDNWLRYKKAKAQQGSLLHNLLCAQVNRKNA